MEPTRREILQMLSALGLSGGAITALAQHGGPVTADDVRGALVVAGYTLADDEVDAIRRALQWNLDRFQAVRELDIDDAIAPAVTFVPSRM